MENNYKVIIADNAKANLRNLVKYIEFSLQSAKAAVDTLEMLLHEIEKLADFPHLAKVVEDKEYNGLQIRKYVVNQYVIMYIADDDAKEVWIYHILHSRQDYTRFI
jgi:plasmid stabilization system protein ParE